MWEWGITGHSGLSVKPESRPAESCKRVCWGFTPGHHGGGTELGTGICCGLLFWVFLKTGFIAITMSKNNRETQKAKKNLKTDKIA